MAAKKKKARPKKAKSKTKKKKASVKKTKTVKKKKAVKKSAKKPKVRARKAPARKTAAKSAKPAKVADTPPSVPEGERIGVVTHFFNHLSVAIIQLDNGMLRTGDVIHIKGHTSDFRQMVGSMEVDHMHVDEVRPGTSFGLRVIDHAREHDVVYKITNP